MSGVIAYPAQLRLDCGPVSAVDLALYAAASGDHNPLHLDAEVARAAGFERPIVHGMLTMAYVARLFTRSFGAGSLRAIETRFTGVASLGDTVCIEATLDGVEDSLGRYALRARAGDGRELVSGHARVAARQPA
jgi:acyl dehydratase